MATMNFDFEAWLNLPTSVLLNEAWRLRRQYFSDRVFFSAPGAKAYENEYYRNQREDFVTISLTGNECALDCAHCRKKLLATMLNCSTPSDLLATVKHLRVSGCKGVLLSGGANKEGAVPVAPFFEAIKEITSWGVKVIVHTGLAEESTIDGLKEAGVEQVLFDVIGDQETIKEVYHLDKEPQDYLRVLELCQKYRLPVAPHIVIGLNYGQLAGEIEALKMISLVQPKYVVIVILTPMAGTPMAKVVPPSVEDCGRLIALARLTNPSAYLSLGCARPAGYQRPLLEQYALNAGVNAIAYPSPDTIGLAREMKLEAEFTSQCCTLFSLDQ
ncbi:radical SAM protein [Desulfitobacterium sp.]|uniref:radical SAM protein n=1 Tax=Desulfitobacterium sp. TaxID=49981 RepID=UPI002B200AD1|nr:radical SAM protein [Desulfitobacterium sp.]MEA4901587.1 radical SAM protein [Desulfitobacterium sp.]